MQLLEESGLVSYVGKVNMDREASEALTEESADVSARTTVEWIRAVKDKFLHTKPILTPRFIPCCTDQLMEQLREIAASSTRGGFVSLMIHEQYFYSDYVNYRPDFARRVLEACAYLAEKGYAGRHVSEAAGLV